MNFTRPPVVPDSRGGRGGTRTGSRAKVPAGNEISQLLGKRMEYVLDCIGAKSNDSISAGNNKQLTEMMKNILQAADSCVTISSNHLKKLIEEENMYKATESQMTTMAKTHLQVFKYGRR